jgi:hypothetical protein
MLKIGERMCSLAEAFDSFIDEVDKPRKESIIFDSKPRKHKRRAQLPPEEPRVVEPDRPANRPPSVVDVLTSGSSTPTNPSATLNALDRTDYFPHPSTDSADKNVYKLEPDWASVFQNLPEPDWIKQSKQAAAPAPFSVDGLSTLWQDVPNSQQLQAGIRDLGVGSGAATGAGSRFDIFQQRLDELFQKLDAIEQSKSESAIPEVLLFVLGGIFLILLMDILVKQGTQASLLLAAAGGTRSYKRYMPFR